ncbi:MAG: hypothetical protein B7Y85_12540 [Brevundimonas sp. 32-68-21]|nr:MAG: hypothetical protein B7Y85_12540 [Brevundimonas sp. 32-68-21]
MSDKPTRGRRLLERVRHARYPLHGWRRWAVIAGQGTAGFVALFAAVNLALSLSTFRGDEPLSRTVHELRVLWFSPPDGQPMSPTAFPTVYGRDLGPAPDTAAIHAYLEREAEDGVFLLDHVMVDRILTLNGRIDARSLPSGVYVGDPDRLSAEIAPYTPDAYDFPSSGEALHEMTRITRDPARVAEAVEALKGAQARLEAEGLTYGLLAPNSNTAVGCVLERSGSITQAERSSILLALRAPGFGAACE